MCFERRKTLPEGFLWEVTLAALESSAEQKRLTCDFFLASLTSFFRFLDFTVSLFQMMLFLPPGLMPAH